MNELHFEIELRWSGTGRGGGGEILTDDLTLELSAPESMGGRGVGTNSEELLVSAVSSCYTATLFAGILVSPTILGGDVTRQPEYEAAAQVAHDRCFIGRALAPGVSYEVGSVQIREAMALGIASDEARPPREHADTARESIDERSPAELAANASP